ncbi:alpha/beta fold hydrolase [Micromonospora sp. NPDC000089]|uniref:alpha/beta fold hydrolase n=1 Tax=unclassified Micromonospora TaxID=2617518 RepID=UPI0036A81261
MTQSSAGAAAHRPFGDLRHVDAGALTIGYVDAGPPDGDVVVLLHGWPYDIHSFAEVVPLLTRAGLRVLVPHLRGFGTTRIRAADAPRNGQQAALAADTLAFLDALGVASATLAGFDWGARTACVIAALWPERCRGLVAVSGYLIAAQESGRNPLPPKAELSWWYQFYFATERGRRGYAANLRDFARLIWHTASPRWDFDDATFDRSAASLDNPDHVDVVIHNYRWRLGLAEGEPRYDEIERRLAANPPVTVPTISLEGDANGAPHLDPSMYAGRFTGPYEHRTVGGGVGHNLPQEAPEAFADAVLAVARR